MCVMLCVCVFDVTCSLTLLLGLKSGADQISFGRNYTDKRIDKVLLITIEYVSTKVIISSYISQAFVLVSKNSISCGYINKFCLSEVTTYGC